MRKEKKATMGNQMLYFIFLFMLLMIGVAIVAGTVMYYGSDYDFRLFESEVLNFKIRNCIMTQGLDKNTIEKFYEKCLINKTVIEKHNMMIKICANSKNKEECLTDEKPFFQIGTNFQICGFYGAAENENYAKCAYSTFSSSDGNLYTIITSSNQKLIRRNV